MKTIDTLELKPGDVIVEIRRKRGKNVEVRTKIKTIRQGGHVPTPRIIGKDKEGNHVVSEAVSVDPVPERLIPTRDLIINESFTLSYAGHILVDR